MVRDGMGWDGMGRGGDWRDPEQLRKNIPQNRSELYQQQIRGGVEGDGSY